MENLWKYFSKPLVSRFQPLHPRDFGESQRNGGKRIKENLHDEFGAPFSSGLDLMDAALDPKCANLEIQALDELIQLQGATEKPQRTHDENDFDIARGTPGNQVTFKVPEDMFPAMPSPCFLRTPFTHRIDAGDTDFENTATIVAPPRSDLF